MDWLLELHQYQFVLYRRNNFLLTVILDMAIQWHSMDSSWSHAKVLQ